MYSLHQIYLTFSNYELNKPNDCDSNFIEIYEENLTEENQTVKFCGTRTEPQQSKSNVFNIRHHALPTAASSRFEIIYTAFRDRGTEGKFGAVALAHSLPADASCPNILIRKEGYPLRGALS